MSEHDKKSGLNRRDLFSILPVAAAAVAVPEAALGHNHAAQAAPSAPPPFHRQTFNDQQWKTVRVLCDWIIPKDERSGSATDAQVPEFMDDWLAFQASDSGNDRLRSEIFGGLTWLDRESNAKFGADFANASSDQQKQLIDRIAWPDKTAAEDRIWAAFFDVFRSLTVSGFFSSKMGVEDLPYLGNTVVTNWVGCDPKVWTIIEKRMQEQDSQPPSKRPKHPSSEDDDDDDGV